ncbi:CHAT domain-containing protein [Comamonadaceae bacterium G21597-S1]|nr:CHAT domain-containing protein [Comamonadaceae bacterium G21597-S1]
MATVTQGEGVILEYDEQAFAVSRPTRSARPAARRGGRSFDAQPQLLTPATPAGDAGADDDSPVRQLADRLVARGTVRRAGETLVLGAGPGAPTRRRRAAPPSRPTRLTVPLAADEQAVVIVEGDGVLAWRFGHEAPASALGPVRRSAPHASRALVFDLDFPPVGAPEPVTGGAARRGWLRDRLVAGAKAIVLYFAADVAVRGAVHLLERKRRTGPVILSSATDATQWRTPRTLAGLKLPQDRTPRVLLFVHGTFSSTIGGFGALTGTPWGQRLLTAAMGRYDAVIGFDHRSLGESPRENAQALLDTLRTMPGTGRTIDVDAICHSRGGLVLRTLIEHLLPGAGLDLAVRRAVFVAATNQGTELARPDNWETLIDLVTNLASATSKALSLFPQAAAAAVVFDEVVDSVGDFVKYLINVAIAERKVPGVAAMDPGGDFVAELNQTQPGQPLPADIACYAVVSDFQARLFDDGAHMPKEMPRRLAFLLADGVVDRLMRGAGSAPVPNDLVVDVASMTGIDQAVGGYVRDVLDFGRNPLVYHTNYFVRPETAGRLAQWLHLPSPLEGVDPLSLVGAQRRFMRLRADTPLEQVRERLATNAAPYIVISRPDPSAPARQLHYAATPEELLSFTADRQPDAPLIDAFDLHETAQSDPRDAQQLPFDGGSVGMPHLRPHARRAVVVSGNTPQAVLDEQFVAIDNEGLAVMALGLEPASGSMGAVARDVPNMREAPQADAPYEEAPYEEEGAEEAEADGDDGAASMPPSRRARPSLDRESFRADQPVRRMAGAGRGTPAKKAATARHPAPAGASRPAPVGPVGATRPAAAAPAAVDTRTEVFAAAEMPRETPLGKDAMVTVTLSAEQIEVALGAASAKGKFKVRKDDRISVQVVPRSGFDYSKADPTEGLAQDLDVPRPHEPLILDFSLTAVEEGPAEVSVAVRKGAQRLVMMTLHAQVISPHLTPARGAVASDAPVVEGAECGVCTTLEIFDRRNSGQLQYEFVLRSVGPGGVNDRFRSAPMQVDAQAYVEARYKEIEDAWLGSQRALDIFNQRLQDIGGRMFRSLFPPKMQETLWHLAQAGELDSILVHSDEPFLPWEVVFLDDPDAPAASGHGQFFGELGLCRWLFGAAPVCEIAVRPGRSRYVIPHYPDPQWTLANAEGAEQDMLKSVLGAKAVKPMHAEVLKLLRQKGSFDILHFACHGQADAQQIDSAALMLEGQVVQTGQGAQWNKEMLLASTVEQVADLRGADGNRPLVIVNACQTGRLGYSLTGLGGFATAFLGTREGTGDSRGKAGAFVGALWSVGDDPASGFVAELYAQLLAGKTMSQAVRAARKAAAQAGEGTWLAYTVYAHPHLKLRLGG